MRRLICRVLGHTLHPDPGDNVLYCTRCHTCPLMTCRRAGA